ncbi:MAG: GumC family protein, partial [Limisphaerales bacterium]
MDTAKTSEAPQSKLHFLDYWRIIRIRKTVILAVFLLVVITTTIVTWFLPESYVSTVRIAVEKDSTVIPGIDTKQVVASYDPYWLQTEFEKIASSSILNEVIKRLDLTKRWTAKLSPDHPLNMEETYIILKNQLRVRQSRNTSLIEISVFSEDRNEAAEIANMVALVYRDSRLKQSGSMRAEGIKTLKKELNAKNEEVKEAQQKVNQLRLTNNIPDVGDSSFGTANSTLNTETLRSTERLRIEAEADYVQYNTLLNKIKQLKGDSRKTALPTAMPAPDTRLVGLLQDLSLAEQKLTALLQDFTKANPEVQRAQAVVDKIKTQLDTTVEGIIVGLETKSAHLKARFDEIQTAVNALKTADIEQAARNRPYFDAKRDLEELQRIRQAIALRINQEEIEAELPPTSIVDVTDPAVPGMRPVKPNKPLNIALGVIVGLIVGVGLAFFIEYLDTSVKTIDDVERSLQAPVLGVIPQNVGTLLNEGPESPHAEAYRVLRTNILFTRKNDSFNTVTVVSGGVGEGKSTTLMNLATIFAQNGHRVLVVDSDLRRPSLHKILKLSNSIGLTNFLLKQNTLEEVIQTTGLPTLDF